MRNSTTRNTTKTMIIGTLAACVMVSAIDVTPAQARAQSATTQQAQNDASMELSARKRHHRRHYRGNDRAALQMFGAMMGIIGTAIARDRAERDCRRYGYCGYGYYGYRPPPRYRYYRHRGPYYRY